MLLLDHGLKLDAAARRKAERLQPAHRSLYCSQPRLMSPAPRPQSQSPSRRAAKGGPLQSRGLLATHRRDLDELGQAVDRCRLLGTAARIWASVPRG
jgi:hypothetical protein